MTNHELSPVGLSAAESFSPPIVAGGGGDDLSLRGVVKIWARRRWLIIGSIILGATCAALLIAFMKPVYESTATIELNNQNSDSIDLDLGGSSVSSLGLGGGDLEVDLKTEAEVLKSDSLAMAVIRQLNLNAQSPFMDRDHPFVPLGIPGSESPSERTRLLKIFSDNLKVDTVNGTKLIQVSFFSHDPKQAADVANAMINSYMQMYLQSHYAAVSQASDWMTKQLADLKANVESSEKQLADFEKKSGILALPTEAEGPAQGEMGGTQIQIISPVIQKLDDLNAELTAAETDRIQKEAIYRLAVTGNPDVILGLTSSPIAQGSSLLAPSGGQQDLLNLESLESKRSDLQVAMAQGENIYGPNNRHLKDLQTQLNTVNGQVRDEMKKVVDRAGADLKVAQQTESAVRARFNDAQVQAGKLNDENVQLTILSQEAFSRKKLYEDLYSRLQEADVSAGVKATNIDVVDPAFTPFKPYLPKPVLFLGLGLFCGAFLGFGAAHVMETMDTTVVSLPEIEEITGSAVIAVIPEFKRALSSKKGDSERRAEANGLAAGQATAWIIAHPTSIASEAFRTLRTGVFLSRPGGPKTILITSSVPAEGKSTVAFNLAVAMAQNGRKVVVVEADMRRPAMKRFMSLGSDIGLSSVLAEVVALDEAIVRGVCTANLDVLPAGPVPPLPAELLSSMKFDSVLGELRARYDVVLIDSPPALILTDAITIALKVEAVVWIVRAGAATRPHLVRAAQQIRRSRLPFIGYVLNGLDTRIDPYGYSYGYYGYDAKRYGAYYGKDRASDA